jgi:elongation factor P
MTKIYANDLRSGQIIKYDNIIYRVFAVEYLKTGRGGGHMQVILKDFYNDRKKDVRINTEVKLDLCSFEMIGYVFSYDKGDELVCFTESGEEITFSKRLVDKDILELLLDEEIESIALRVHVLDDEIQKITLPKKAPVIIADTEPYLKGQSADSSVKPAQLKNGWKIQIPVHIEQGDKIIIDTETKSYDSKA